jgi:hypothetical protein
MTQPQWFSGVGELGKANIQIFRLANCWYHIYGPAFLLLVLFGNGDIWSKIYNLLDEEANEEAGVKAGEDVCEKACEEFKESERKECEMTCLAVSVLRLS